MARIAICKSLILYFIFFFIAIQYRIRFRRIRR
nr:MAG TPA: chitin synthase regulator [Caudoviricetes sp.]